MIEPLIDKKFSNDMDAGNEEAADKLHEKTDVDKEIVRASKSDFVFKVNIGVFLALCIIMTLVILAD